MACHNVLLRGLLYTVQTGCCFPSHTVELLSTCRYDIIAVCIFFDYYSLVVTNHSRQTVGATAICDATIDITHWHRQDLRNIPKLVRLFYVVYRSYQ